MNHRAPSAPLRPRGLGINHPLQKGTQVNHTTRSARTPLLRAGLFAVLSGTLRRRGSGALSGPRGRASLILCVAAALVALSASPASAATTRPSEAPITAAGAEALVNPFALTVDPSDNLWLTDIGSSKVSELDSSGALLHQNDGSGSWAGSSFIRGIAYGEGAAEIYVADSNFDDLWGLKASDATNSGTDLFGPPWDSGEHAGCCFIKDAVDNSSGVTGGNIYVSNGSTVSRVEPTGLKTFAAANFTEGPGAGTNELTGPFGAPLSLATNANGDLYVGAANGVFVFEPSGKLIHEFTQAGGSAIGSIEAIAVDPTSGTILAAEEKAILELSPTGALEAKITEADGAPFGAVRGLAVDSTGTLYVADGPNHRVDAFGPAVALPPESDGGSVTAVSSEAATLLGDVNPNQHPTTYQFQFGTFDCSVEPSPCTSIPASPASIGSGKTIVSVSQRLTGLAPATTYHYRLLVDDNEGHHLVGPDRTFTTQSKAPFGLPDSRQWQLVSPPDKHGSVLKPIEEVGVVQAAAAGDAISYLANAPIEAAPQGDYSNGDQVLSTRDSAGWSSRNLTVPHAAPVGAQTGSGFEYRFFNEDLSKAFVQPFGPFTPSISPEATEQTAFLHENLAAGDPTAFCAMLCYHPLVTTAPGIANVPPGTKFEDWPFSGACTSVCGPHFIDATGDGRFAILRSAVPLTSGTPDNEGLYEWRGGESPTSQLRWISVLPNGKPGGGVSLGEFSFVTRHAISNDGNYVVFSASEEAEGGGLLGDALYLRDVSRGRTVQLDAAEAGCLTCESGIGRFQFASQDGSRIFFTDPRPLTANAGIGSGGYQAEYQEGDLYECRIVVGVGGDECQLTDLTPKTGSESAGVLRTTIGGGEDAGYIYFVANGALAENPGADGTHAVGGHCRPSSPPSATCNLYRLHAGQITYIARLTKQDEHLWSDQLNSMPARVSPDGRWLAFMAQESLTGYDNRDLATGQPVAEVYLYDAATANLVCASCDPTGTRPHGVEYFQLEPGSGGLVGGPRNIWPADALVAANVPGWTGFDNTGTRARHQPRYLSNSGRLFFNTVNPLVPADSNGTQDVYQFEPPGVGSCTTLSHTFSPIPSGCIDLISSGTSGRESAFLDASETGDDVFFLTSARLAPQDTDNARDVYDAHVCSAAGPCLPPTPPQSPDCSGDACQLPATPPDHPTPGTALLNGPGNLLQCPKGKVKRHGKCVKKHKAKRHHKKKHHKKHRKSKRANTNRGGAK